MLDAEFVDNIQGDCE